MSGLFGIRIVPCSDCSGPKVLHGPYNMGNETRSLSWGYFWTRMVRDSRKKVESARLMLATDLGYIWWWQVYDLGDGFIRFCHQHDVGGITFFCKLRQYTFKKFHHHQNFLQIIVSNFRKLSPKLGHCYVFVSNIPITGWVT